jgi:hypothetical protein
MKNVITNKYSYLALLCSLLLLSACATSAPKPPSSIEDRATLRWEKLLGDDIAGAYEYLSPGYRSSVSSVQYQRSILLKRVRWTDAKYVKSECEDVTCDVTLMLGYSVSGAIPGIKSYSGKQDIVETWILTDGVWYLVP